MTRPAGPTLLAYLQEHDELCRVLARYCLTYYCLYKLLKLHPYHQNCSHSNQHNSQQSTMSNCLRTTLIA